MNTILSGTVKGMHCAACSTRIERVLSGLDGVQKVSVNLATEKIELSYDDSILQGNDILEQVEKIGFEIKLQGNHKKNLVSLNIKGMHCAACSTRIERVLGNSEGIDKIQVNLATETAEILKSADLSIRSIKEKISTLGFTATTASSAESEFEKQEEENNRQIRKMRISLTGKFLFVLPLLYLSMGEMIGVPIINFLTPQKSPLLFGLTQLFLTIPVMWLGRSFYTIGFPALFRKSPNMDSLIAVGTGAAFIYSFWNLLEIALGNNPMAMAMDLYFESVGVLIALVSLGKYFEKKAKSKTTGAIKKLLQLAPRKATLIKDNVQQDIEADDIEVNDILLVKPGEQIPADGTIVSGRTGVDESMLTGEADPVKKSKGDTLYCGTINQSNTVKVKVTHSGENSVLAGIIRLVQSAQGSKAPIARIADQVSYYFVPAVLVFAVIVGLGWFFVGSVGLSQSLRFSIAVLVIACPCAMGLATPISIMVGTGRGAQLGILIRNGEVLEKACKITSVFMDKTGTITSGKPSVSKVHVLPGALKEKDILRLIGSLEQSSEHPLATAIVSYCDKNTIPLTQPQSFNTHPGNGVSGIVGEHKLLVGNRKLFSSEPKLEKLLGKETESLEEKGKTILFFSIDDNLRGYLAIADQPKEEARESIQYLSDQGISTIMVTGDNEKTARSIAESVGIQEIYAEVLPKDKLKIIEENSDNGSGMAMVGDGINDAPALAKADIGIAMGTGIDIAIESGDIVLVKGNLTGIAEAIELSEAVMANIKQNLFWAFAFNIIGIPIAAGLLVLFGGPSLNPMMAGGAMAMSSVMVVSNALRLRNFTPAAQLRRG